MRDIVRMLIITGDVLLAIPVLYLACLSVVALIRSRHHRSPSPDPERYDKTFVLLVPAHNEEAGLSRTLASLNAVEYPRDKRMICVIADNCTDTTALVARRFPGVQVFERHDTEHRGKGFALAWGMQQLERTGQLFDGYVVVDADSVVNSGYLAALARSLAAGARAIQSSNTVLNLATSPSSALRWIAFTLVNHVRQLGRTGIGGSATLNGTGMCLSRNLLVEHPWNAFGITEDYQYYLTLVLYGERVAYVPDAVLNSDMPESFDQLQSQDVRWETPGDNTSPWKVAGSLIWAGISRRSFVQLDAAAELLTPQLSVLTACCLVLTVGALLVMSPMLVAGTLLLGALLGFYVSSAFLLGHPPLAVYLAVAHAPRFVARKLWILAVVRHLPGRKTNWVRTSRGRPPGRA